MRRVSLILVVVAAGCVQSSKVGKLPDGSNLVATGQILRPAGEQIAFSGRPIDLCLTPDGKTVLVKDNRGLVVIDAETKTVVQELAVKGGTSLKGIVATATGVWLSGAGSTISHASLKDGKYEWDRTIELPKAEVGGNSYPCSMALVNGKLVVAASRDNSVFVCDEASGKIENRFPVDVAPYDVRLTEDGGSVYVSCWSPKPPAEAKTALSSGSAVEVDDASIAKAGAVLKVSLSDGKIEWRVPVALQPMQLLLKGKTLWVGHGNADEVSMIDTDTHSLIGTVNTKPEKRLPFGSMPGAIALDGDTLYTANGGDNAVGVFDLATQKPKGFIPAGWCPGAVLIRNGVLWVANIKGDGSEVPRKADGKFNVHAHRGTLSVIPLPTPSQLSAMTEVVAQCNLHKDALNALDRSTAEPGKPVPEKLGEKSPIEHIVYILKENRTYDQVLGDMEKGDGDPSLCMFGKDVTPNHHSLAEEFVLLDNFYCNGVLSADGHSWAMEGVVTGYLERSFGGFTRSYPYGGDDAINTARSGFIWDDVLGAGLTFHNFGEFDDAKPDPKRTWTELFAEHTAGKITTKFPKRIEVERMKTYSDPDFPGWNMEIPDQIRADIFLDKFAKMDSFPNLTIIYLPQDHTSGASPGQPTPQACVADNDLALGRIIEALSKSKWWPKMAIFVMEDDPQNGFDHVDGHRSPAFVVSPYVKRKAVVSDFYNQTSMLHTMSRILGLPPITQFAAMSPLMSACFTETPDLTPYTCKPATYPIDKLNPTKDKLDAMGLYLAQLTEGMDLSRPDAIEDDTMNRILWHAVKGNRPYPSQWAGAHGKGLNSRGLKLGGLVEDDD